MQTPQAKIPGFPPDIEIFSMNKFLGLNTKAARQSIDDQEFAWCENWMPIGEGNLRTMYGQGSNVFTGSSKTIIYYFFFNISSTQYVAIFFSDGTATQLNMSTLATTVISATGNTFYNGGRLPFAQQYGSSGIIIVTTAQTNGYFAWDGTTLYSPTNTAPAWLSGLTTPFTPTADTHTSTTIDTISSMTGIEVGMSVTGTGIPANTVITAVNSVGSSITISNATTSSVNTITLTITWAMPTGIQGTGVEIYSGYVWVINGNQRINSAPGNGADFSTSDGGGVVPSTDSFLKQRHVALKQSSGFLYDWGDSSINSISNPQTAGSPATTTYNNLNVDPQVGTPWPATVQPFGEGLVFANTSGVYVLYGGLAKKVSDKLDGIFATASLPLSGTSVPSAGIVTIFGIRLYVLLIPGAVDYLGVSRPLMFLWDGQKWFIGSQTSSITYISGQENQSQLNIFGTDGTNLFPLFTVSSMTLKKILRGKLWNGQSYLITKQVLRDYLQIDDNAGTGIVVTVNNDSELTSVAVQFLNANLITFINNLGGALQFQNNSSGNINFSVPADAILYQNADIGGQLIGLTLTTQAQDATLISASVAYKTVRGLF